MAQTKHSERILDVLRQHEGRDYTTQELGELLDLDSRVVATSLGNCMRRSHGDWKRVQRIGHGIYRFDSTIAPLDAHELPSWTQVGAEGELVVLRDPQGHLYGARPLKEFLNA